MTSTYWASTKVDPELATLLRDVVENTRDFDGKSELLRFGIYLALSEIVREHRITDPELKLRIYEYLHRVRNGRVPETSAAGGESRFSNDR